MLQLLEFIKKRLKLLARPEEELHFALNTETFELAVSSYITLLFLNALLAGLSYFLYQLGKVIILDAIYQANIYYPYTINFAAGLALGAGFLVLFIGVFMTLLISIILKPFFKRQKYTRFLSIILYSLTPLLLFGWLPFLAPSLVLWSLVLFIVGIRLQDTRKRRGIDIRD